MDDDHEKLARMVASLGAVIAHGGTPAVVHGAVTVLRERLRLHFRLEEALACRAAPAKLAWLKSEHADLLARIDRMDAAIPAGNAAVSAELESFTAAAARHEEEVDPVVFGR